MKRNHIVLALGLLFLVYTLQSCLLPNAVMSIDIAVENNSDDTVSVYIAIWEYGRMSTKYPNEKLPQNIYIEAIKDSLSNCIMKIPPHTSSYVWSDNVYGLYSWTDTETKYRKYFNDMKIDTLSFYFINIEAIQSYGYAYVAEHNMVLMRYDLSVSDMDSLNYWIPYPPKENMRNMKIWNSTITGNGFFK